MADEKASDSDRLVQCFARGTLQRHQNHRRGTSGPNTPTRSLSSSCHNVTSPEAASSEVDMRTPHKTPRLDRPSPSIVLDSRRNGKVPEGNASNQISPGVFYGSPFGKPSNKPLHVLRLLNEIQNDLVGQRTSRDVESAGAFKLASASRCAYTLSISMLQRVWAVSNCYGALDFEIQGPSMRYRSMLPEHRHHYEIIQEGKPCHMYFDLEFNRKANIEADGEAMVDILLSVVQKAFLDIYALEYDPSWTIELDSTTEGCMLFTGLSFASSCPHFLLVFFFLGIFLVYKSGEIAPNMCM
ncbi:hypothetical protein AXG93_392s1600 [Marchantia polymorpha subsp. ruderalis]|uniref:DNA-directed primase/polymerase protein n=1 Tax=Marchantia polymorpha subsp. ruderalis TaxID=1480154 RepID=A0A176WRS4_MARPO|nr:hypothetical protein AXG93_392s1600 [Marchantia polymorpha subsp. ruderalis]